jgi:hypothetical protein
VLEPPGLLILQSLSHFGDHYGSMTFLHTLCLNSWKYPSSCTASVTSVGNAKDAGTWRQTLPQKEKKIWPHPSIFQPPVSALNWQNLIRSQLARGTNHVRPITALWIEGRGNKPTIYHTICLSAGLLGNWKILVWSLHNKVLPKCTCLETATLLCSWVGKGSAKWFFCAWTQSSWLDSVSR